VIESLKQLHESKAIQIVRIKNHFSVQSAGGWADLMVNFTSHGAPGAYQKS
jgi:hypothetical protein